MAVKAQPSCRRLVDGVQIAPDPQTVFWMIVQTERGERAGQWLDYHEYEATNVGWCDMSRPGSIRTCNVDVLGLLENVYGWCAGDFLYSLPEWADWSGWSGDGAPGYTSIDFFMEARFFNGETASRMTLACDVSPDNSQAVCMRRDRADHFNYILTEPGPILSLVNALNQ